MVKPNVSSLGIILNYDFFNGAIISNTASDSFYVTGMFGTEISGTLSFNACQTPDCNDVAHFNLSLGTVSLTQNKVQAITIKLINDSANSKVKLTLDSNPEVRY